MPRLLRYFNNRPCIMCGQRLPETTRRDAAYCTNACRQRHYRQRKTLRSPQHPTVTLTSTAPVALRAVRRGDRVPV